jgi:hypothetical protein
VRTKLSAGLSGRSLAALVLLLSFAGAAGCRHSPKDPDGPPDLMKSLQADRHARAFHLRAFQMQHIWAGAGHGPDGADFRAKVALWDYSNEDPMVAELYFHDADRFDPAGRHHNPDPDKANPPYQIHFPMSAVGPVLNVLRSANEHVYLHYDHKEWTVRIFLPEVVGSD